MEFEIIFCNDGILRIKYGNKPMIPAMFIHNSNTKYKNDLGFWTRFWEEYTYFEEGLTVRQFLSCLEPWADFFEDLTHKNIQAFIDESKKPALVKTDDEHVITWISLSYNTEIELKLEYEPEEFKNNNFAEWLNKERNARLVDEWEIHGSYKLTGYCDGVVEQYSVDHCAMTDIANLPIILDSKQTVVFSDFGAKRILGSDYKLFDKDTFGIKTLEHGSGYKTTYIKGERLHRFREVVEGFFWWFPHDPISREQFNNEIKSSLEQYKQESNDDEIDDDESNVIPLFKNKDDSIKEIDDESDTKIKKVVIAPGAFDSLIRQSNSKMSFWEELMEKAKHNDDVVLKIGTLNCAQPPENRVYAYIAPTEDISTPYKKI